MASLEEVCLQLQVLETKNIKMMKRINSMKAEAAVLNKETENVASECESLKQKNLKQTEKLDYFKCVLNQKQLERDVWMNLLQAKVTLCSVEEAKLKSIQNDVCLNRIKFCDEADETIRTLSQQPLSSLLAATLNSTKPQSHEELLK